MRIMRHIQCIIFTLSPISPKLRARFIVSGRCWINRSYFKGSVVSANEVLPVGLPPSLLLWVEWKVDQHNHRKSRRMRTYLDLLRQWKEKVQAEAEKRRVRITYRTKQLHRTKQLQCTLFVFSFRSPNRLIHSNHHHVIPLFFDLLKY